MANYKIYDESKLITVSGELTPAEESIISIYIGKGYAVKPKRANNGSRVSEQDILNYFDKNNDEEGKKEYKAKRDAYVPYKDGRKNKEGKVATRKAGFLEALKWFKEHEKYGKVYNEIAESKKKK